MINLYFNLQNQLYFYKYNNQYTKSNPFSNQPEISPVMSVPTEQLENLFAITKRIEYFFKEINNKLSFCLEPQKPPYLQKKQIPKVQKPINFQIQHKKYGEYSKLNKPKKVIRNKPKVLSSFFLFLRDKRQFVKEQYPQLSSTQLSNVMGRLWQQMSEVDKLPYLQEYRLTKEKYQKQIELERKENINYQQL